MSKKSDSGTLRVTKHSDAYWRVAVDIPPLNIFGPANIPQLEQVVSAIETDTRVKVVVFDSAVEGFFLTHYDVLSPLEESTKFPPGRTGLQPLPDMLVRLSRAPVVSIALIRGRATGVGSELALACDMSFASREKAILSQWEVGAGLVPGGGKPRLVSRESRSPCLREDHRAFGSRARPSRAAIFTKSARESAFIFCIILPRCAFTVISLMPRSLPTCLFNKPATTKAITSRSRQLSEA